MTSETPTRTRPERYDPSSLEQNWRERWEADQLYVARDDDPRPKKYDLTMYPYPSGDLHIGHWYAMTGPDIVARMEKLMTAAHTESRDFPLQRKRGKAK